MDIVLASGKYCVDRDRKDKAESTRRLELTLATVTPSNFSGPNWVMSPSTVSHTGSIISAPKVIQRPMS
jgi:hypothetical protein